MRQRLSEAAGRDVSRETLAKVEAYVSALLEESERQNLIARSTWDDVWTRHILDSAQLCRHAPQSGRWLDIGAGAGLPGIIVAILTGEPIVMIEPRKLRAEFLQRCIDSLRLSRAEVRCCKVDRVTGSFDIVTARAVASLDQLFIMAQPLSHPGTCWVLPKGRSGAKELAEARRSWHGEFRTEPSLTDAEGMVVIARQVRPRHGRKDGAGA